VTDSTTPKVEPRVRNRAQILQAAHDLMEERGNPHFSADELAERAGVSRRTVFNHFLSLDEIVTLVCADVLAAAVEDLQVALNSESTTEIANISHMMAHILNTVDLTPTISYLYRVLSHSGPSQRTEQVLRDVFARVTDMLTSEAVKRSATADPVEIEIRINSLLGGTGVIAGHWGRETGGEVTQETRELWRGLVRRLLEILAPDYLSSAP